MFNFSLVGDWPGVQVALNQLDPMIKSSTEWGMRKATEAIVKKVKNHINAQDLGWPQRSSGYNAGDPRILVDTEAYYGAIQAYKKGDVYYAGVKPNKTNAQGHLITNYALMNEYGGGNLPPRPVWQPSVAEYGGKQGVRATVVRAIFDKVKILRAKGFDVRLGTI